MLLGISLTLRNRLVRTRMPGGVRGRGLAAPFYSIVAAGRFMVMIVSRNVGRSLRETDYLLENFSIALRSSSWVLAYSSRGIPFTAASQP